MPNCGRYSSSSSICLLGRHFRQVVWGALQLPLGLSRGSVTVAYLAALSGQKPIPFDSPLNPRNSIFFFLSIFFHTVHSTARHFQTPSRLSALSERKGCFSF